MDDPVYLDWQARLVETLSRAGFEVVCKPHPWIPAKGCFNGRPVEFSKACEFRYGWMEELWDDIDAFVFDYVATKAFWHALCTNKPVVWIDHGLHPWHEEPYAMLQRRCEVVPAWFDEDNRLQTDTARLVKALRTPLPEPEFSFVDRYMLGGSNS